LSLWALGAVGGDFAGLPGGRRATGCSSGEFAQRETLVAGGRNEIGWKGLRWAANLRKAALWLAVGRFLATVRGLGTKADDDFQSWCSLT
jgi:hypothetical protein